MLASGVMKRMIELVLGDKVAVRGQDGRLTYEDIYAFGHRDASASSSFVQLTSMPIDGDMADRSIEKRTLELTALHFVPVLSGLRGKVVHKRAQDVRVGDRMWVAERGSVSVVEVVVTSISRVEKQGLYNRYTMGGTIVVNGVVASAHNKWFLDDVFELLALPLHWLPAVYQMILWPVRVLYSAMDKDSYVALYGCLDSMVDISAFGTKYGGITAVSAAVSAILGFVLMSRRV